MAPWMIGAPFAALGVVGLCVGLHFLGKDRALRSWPQADGVITSSTIEATKVRRKDRWGYWQDYESCVPAVRYTYTANANTIDRKQLEGSRIKREPFATERKAAQEVIDHYPVGKAVKVYYDPKDPTRSVLELQAASVGAVIFIAVGSFFLLLGLAISVVPLLLRR